MGFRNGAFATVWEVREGRGKYTDVRISISRKDKNSGNYETDFSGYVRFIGDAATDALGLQPKDRIKIGECETTNRYDKEKNVTYTNHAVFSFERADSQGGTAKPAAKKDEFMNVPEGIDEELPFN